MKKIGVYFLLLLTTIMLISCDRFESLSQKNDLYVGQNLNIGIIGEPVDIQEKQIKLLKINFSDLEDQGIYSKCDAIFITKDNFLEASEEKYKLIYKKMKIPIFFIDNKKSIVPFTEDNLTYNEVPDLEPQTYISGFLYKNNKLESWGFDLGNDADRETTINGFYSKIFEIISENKLSK